MVVGKRVLLGLSVLFCLLFGTCSLGTDIETLLTRSVSYTVTFESNSGSYVSSQTVKSGGKATRPSDPSRSGYIFVDWYSNSTLTTAYSFSTPVTRNITLYAGWNSDSSTQPPVVEDYRINIISPQMIDRDIIPVTITPIRGKSNGEITVYYEGVSGTAYSRTTTVPQAAGTYAVTFDVAAAAPWKSASRLFAGVLTLNDPAKQNPLLEHYNINGTGTFDFAAGASRPVTLTRKDNNSSPGTVTVKYTNAATPPVTSTSAPTEIGAYAVSFDVAAASGWNAASGLSVGAVNIINPGFQTPDAGDYIISGTGEFTYDGAPKAVTATPRSGKSQGAITYTYTNAASGAGTSTAPSAVGTYNVTFTVAADPANNWNAVSGLIAGMLVITASTSGISLSETGAYTFPVATVGYVPQTARWVAVTNLADNQATGALTVALSGTNAGSFTLSTTSISSIAVGGTGTFTVVPNTGLSIGTYTATVTVSGSNIVSAAFNVSFTVNPPTPICSISLFPTDTYTFSPATVGYAEQTAQLVTVTNTGNQSTGVLTVVLSGDNANSFTLSKTTISSITVSGTDTFTVVPNTGLAANTYTATVTVSGSNGISAAFSVSFTVNSSTGNIVSPTGIEMIYVPGGSFEMGNEGNEREKPVHTVTLTGFYMGKYQVTQAQYQSVMGSNPSYFTTAVSGESGTPGKLPVERVSWYDAIVFCNKLSIAEDLSQAYRISGSTNPADWGSVPTSSNATWDAVEIVADSNGYRLPTEAQWEYAAKGGNGSPGNYTYPGSNTIDGVAWYRSNNNSMTHEVGKKDPNRLGIYDMGGNVWEWCWDWYGSYSSSAQTDHGGAATGDSRVGRGGSWNNSMDHMRSAYRGFFNPCDRDSAFGFRLTRPSNAVSGFTVTFDSNGGSVVTPQTINSGATATRPTNPTKSGYILVDWYSDSVLTTVYNFSTPVTGNITLYAKWVESVVTSPTGIKMVYVPGGSFEMGDVKNVGLENEKPVHTVTLSGFYMGMYEVTQAQYQAVMRTNPSHFSSNPASGEVQGNRPVERVSWYDAIEFCNALSIIEKLDPYYTIDKGKKDPNNTNNTDSYKWTITLNSAANGYRLPTEAQWEYAAKGGNGTPENYTYSGSNTEDDVAWYKDNSNNMTHEVGKKAVNRLGLFDMSGNVWEWCWDWSANYTISTQIDPVGVAAGGYRVLRGGCWADVASGTRSTVRIAHSSYNFYFNYGFRLVRP